MSIRSKSELKKAAEQAGDLLQQIHDYCAENNLNWAMCDEAKVRFPRGFIRQAGAQRMRLRFVQDQGLRDNLAYTLILSDVVLWVKLRTDLWGTPKHMMTKLYAFLIGTLCESITKDYLSGRCGQNFSKRNEYLLCHDIIDAETKGNLDRLWGLRNRMHLFQLSAREYENEYTEQCHDRCVKTFRQLIGALSADWRK